MAKVSTAKKTVKGKVFTITKKSREAPRPAPAPQRPEVEIFFKYFDAEFYLRQLPENERSVNPVEHYLMHGWKQGLDPSSEFSTNDYLSNYPDVRNAGMNPLEHYARFGLREGRQPKHSLTHFGMPFAMPEDTADGAFHESMPEQFDTGREADQREQISDHVLSTVEAKLEKPFYRLQLKNQNLPDEELATHYILRGWRQGLDPSTAFSTRYYLEANPDVTKAGVNPFYHYLVAGHLEGRFPRHPGGEKVARLRHVEPLETLVEHWRVNQHPKADISAATLAARLRKGPPRLVIAFTHDNYKRNSGGVQLCLQLEEELTAKADAQYLAAYPAVPIPRLVHENETQDNLVNLVLAGEPVGCCRMSDLVEALGKAKSRIKDVALVIHHFLGHNPEQIKELAAAAKARSCAVWVHDYFTLCPSYTLQRNTISYCGAPPPKSNECTLCLFGRERLAHLQRLESFFRSVPVDLIAPSQAALDMWKSRSSLPTRSQSVVPHVTITWKPRAATLTAERKSPVRVGFLGTISAVKGWPTFAELVRHFSFDGCYEFIAFGVQQPPEPNVSLVPVHVTSKDRKAMIKAIAAAKIDIVLHWAAWPETFSFSTFEAIAGGAFVITNPLSGNVAAAVRSLKSGVVLDSEESLIAFFASGKAKQLANQARKRRNSSSCSTTLSRMSMKQVYGNVQ